MRIYARTINSIVRELILFTIPEPARASIPPMAAGRPAQVNSQRIQLNFNLSQYASSPGNMAPCYGRQDSPFLPQRWLTPFPVLIAPTQYTRRDGQAECPG